MSVTVRIREAPNPSDAELNQYTEVIAKAFEYNYFGAALANDKTLQEPFIHTHWTAALVQGEVQGEGEIHVAELPDAGVIGVALWFGPSQMFLGSIAQREAGWNQLMQRLAPEYRDWWSNFLEEYDELVEKILGPGVKLGAYHLQLIGVHPDHQRKGIGRALMRYAEDKAHVARVPTTVETLGATNIEIYKGWEYQLEGMGSLKLPPPHDGHMEMAVFIKHVENDESSLRIR